jgi:hypothetical protein
VTLASPRPPLRVQICGALAIERDGRRLDGLLPGRQGRLLFIYLVVNRHRQAPRDEVACSLTCLAATGSASTTGLGPNGAAPPALPSHRRLT